jgi:hypothetical protein
MPFKEIKPKTKRIFLLSLPKAISEYPFVATVPLSELPIQPTGHRETRTAIRFAVDHESAEELKAFMGAESRLPELTLEIPAKSGRDHRETWTIPEGVYKVTPGEIDWNSDSDCEDVWFERIVKEDQ